jgi:hypothetical protein
MKKYVIILIALILAILFSACELDNLKFGEVRMMYGTNETGRISYDITTFTGTEKGEFQAETGQKIFFTYTADLDKGKLLIEWQDPQGDMIWQKNFKGSDRGQVELETGSPGTYTILIRGAGAGGRFDVSWHAK